MRQSFLYGREHKPCAELAPKTVHLRLATFADVRLYADSALIAERRRHFCRRLVIEAPNTAASWINVTGADRNDRFCCGGFPGLKK